jgi:hypothetical protein
LLVPAHFGTSAMSDIFRSGGSQLKLRLEVLDF